MPPAKSIERKMAVKDKVNCLLSENQSTEILLKLLYFVGKALKISK